MFLGACRRRRRRGGLQLGEHRAAWGATGQLSGIWLGLWVSASGGAAQSASMSIYILILMVLNLRTSERGGREIVEPVNEINFIV